MCSASKKPPALFLAIAVVLISGAGVSALKKIYFMAVGPFPDNGTFAPSWAGGPAVVHAVKIARDHINNRSDILPGYQLELIEADSGCNIISKYLLAFAGHYIENVKHKVIAGIIGPGCSDSTRLLAPVLARQELSVIQIAPSATSSELVNDAYNTTFRIFSSLLLYVEEFMALTRHNRWRRVALLYQGSRRLFGITFQHFLDTKDKNVTVSYQSALYDGFFPIEDIQFLQTRVIFVFTSGGMGARLMCLAYHLDMIYPTFQWVFTDKSNGNFLQNLTVSHDGRTYNCSVKNMQNVIKGIILSNYIFKPTNPDDKSLPVNVSYNEYEEEYNSRLDEKTRSELVGVKWAVGFYDATWALALAITKSLPELSKRNIQLEDYTLGRDDITKIFVDKLLNQSEINFKGVSESRVKFEATRETRTTLIITQAVCNSTDCTEEELGIYNESGLQLNPNGHTAFINDSFQETTITVHVAVGTFILLATLCILIVTILLHLTNIVYHNFKPIKATSPNLSHLIFSGCYLLLVSVIFFAIKDVFNIDAIAYGMLCNLYTLCISLGFSLVFGTICAKIWRVYRIFRHFRSERASGAITDNALILFVMLLVLVDMGLGTTWILVDPWLRRSSGEFSGMEIKVTSTCHCDHFLKWTLAVGAYKGLLILVVVLLAILNRNIQKKEFKHTKKVSMYIYTEVLLGGITLPLFQILTGIDFTASLIVMSGFLLATVCGCLGFVFLPSVVPLIKMKYHGKPVNMNMSRRNTMSLLS